MIHVNAVVIKILSFLEFNVRKIKGSEIEGIVELHMSLYHRKTHFLKYIQKVSLKKHRCKH